MTNEDKIMVIFTAVTIFAMLLAIVSLEIQRGGLGQYDDTITEYMMCIKYNSDCDCSGIILSVYGEEVE